MQVNLFVDQDNTLGLICSKYHYGFIHNDLHALNVRKRLVPADTILYYVDWRKRYYAVPTFGNVYVIIDFGRSVVKLHGKADGYVSSTFTDRGHCRRMIPDNPSIDLVRFAMSIEDQVCRCRISLPILKGASGRQL